MITSEVKLRPPTAAERSALTDLCLRSKAHWGYSAEFISACREELSLNEGDIESGLIRVAEVDGAVAGIVQLDFDRAGCQLEKLFVDPPFIGKGVGRVLMEWAVATARARGVERIVIEADPGAAEFYRRLGARDAGQAASGSIPGRSLPRLILDLPGG